MKIYTSAKTVLSLLLLIFFIHPAFSQKSINDTIIKERLRTIEQMLNQGKSNANFWWNAWLIGYSAATVGQGVVMAFSPSRDTRQDMALGAVTTILGAAGQLIAPMDPASAPGELEGFPEITPQERVEKLMVAEKLLKLSADREESGRSWQQHAICGAVNISSGLITWFGFHRNALAGFENFALNTVITEAQIFTQPTRAMKDYHSYLNKYSNDHSASSKNNSLSLFVYALPGGLGVKLIF